MKFGERVLSIRKASRFSRKTLAGMADMDVSHLARLEHGYVNPSLHMIIQLAVALKVDPIEFVRDLGVVDLPENRKPYSLEDFLKEKRRRDSS